MLAEAQEMRCKTSATVAKKRDEGEKFTFLSSPSIKVRADCRWRATEMQRRDEGVV
jgi:hypothetical protein